MCGLVGYNGASAPDADKLKILWMYNLGRGDDSCGIFWDGLLKKGVGTKANVFNFLESTTLKPIEKYFTVIGHTRKSTVGSHSEENAHPFGFYTKENNKEGEKIGLKNVVPYAVGAHNGVIRNREELRTKYGKKYNYNVDSIELLNIIVDSEAEPEKIKVLNDYEGYAALLWSFTDRNDLFVFRGKSAIGEDNTGERPLFYWKKKGAKAVYISSIKESLMCICDDEEKETAIKAFDTNKIYCISNGNISTLKIEINREGKGASTASTSGSSCDTGRRHTTPTGKKLAKDVFIGFPEKILKKVEKLEQRDTDGSFLLEDEPYYNAFGNERVVFTKGRYFKNGHILGQKLKEGVSYILDENGYAPSNKNFDKKKSKKYFFWNGWIVNTEEDLKWLCEKWKEGKLTEVVQNKTKFKHDQDFKRKFSPHTLMFDDGRLGGFVAKGSDISACYTGTFEPLFNQDKVYEFYNGYFKKVTLATKVDPKNDDKIADDAVDVDAEAEESIEIATTDSDVDIINNYLLVMETVREGSEEISSEKGEVTESLRQKLVKWLDTAWFYLDEQIKKEADSEKEVVDNFAPIY